MGRPAGRAWNLPERLQQKQRQDEAALSGRDPQSSAEGAESASALTERLDTVSGEGGGPRNIGPQLVDPALWLWLMRVSTLTYL